MNLLDTLKQALEALNVATTPLAKDRQEVLAAQTALRTAIAELEKAEPVFLLVDSAPREMVVLRGRCNQSIGDEMNLAELDTSVSGAESCRRDLLIVKTETLKQLIALVRLQHEALGTNDIPLQCEALEAYEAFERGVK